MLGDFLRGLKVVVASFMGHNCARCGLTTRSREYFRGVMGPLCDKCTWKVRIARAFGEDR